MRSLVKSHYLSFPPACPVGRLVGLSFSRCFGIRPESVRDVEGCWTSQHDSREKDCGHSSFVVQPS
ncbi:MAG: hypothetical protein AABZ36_08075 [Nitrospirota bacterium]